MGQDAAAAVEALDRVLTRLALTEDTKLEQVMHLDMSPYRLQGVMTPYDQ